MVRLKTVSIIVVAATLPVFASPRMAFALKGPTSEYYLTDYTTTNGQNNSGIIGVQGSAAGPKVQFVSDQNPAAFGNFAIAVDSTIRTMPYTPGYRPGAQYDLNGHQIAGSYTNPVSYGFFDGTSDINHNYAVQYSSGSVFQFTPDWTNPRILFNTGNAYDLGTTYDPTNNSIWVSPYRGATTMRDYSLSGTLLSSFDLHHQFNSALALDHADDTLWITDAGGSQIEQYSKTGALLQATFFTSPINHNSFYGGEFALSTVRSGILSRGLSTGPAPVPEPAFFQMAGLLGMGGLGFLKRKLRG